MPLRHLRENSAGLSTAQIADACIRLNVPLHIAPPGIRPVFPCALVTGRAAPARIYGSVDIILEAIESANEGDVLVLDNQGRLDEGCLGDLTAIEARAAGMAAIAAWGCHRDTTELIHIGLPIFSYGTYPKGPLRDDARDPEALSRVSFGSFTVTRDDVVFADDDGVMFVPINRLKLVLDTARTIFETERAQAEAVLGGLTLREQLRFRDYLTKREEDASYTFRKHLRALGGAIEE